MGEIIVFQVGLVLMTGEGLENPQVFMGGEHSLFREGVVKSLFIMGKSVSLFIVEGDRVCANAIDFFLVLVRIWHEVPKYFCSNLIYI